MLLAGSPPDNLAGLLAKEQAEENHTVTPSPPEHTASILLTAFGPFDGRPVNGSATVLPLLAERYQAHSLVLPVLWQEVLTTLPNTLAARQADMVIGLGEGHPGHIALELRAQHHAHGSDSAGHPAPQWLGPSVELWRWSRLGLDPAALLTQIEQPAAPSYQVQLSEDAGSYLCNAWLWLASASEATTVVFIHLPPQGERSDSDYQEAVLPGLTQVLAQLITSAQQHPAQP